MVKVISDTSFLIHLATHRIKNIDSIETEIGTLSFIVPKIVKKELEHLAGDPDKKIISEQTLDSLKILKQMILMVVMLIPQFLILSKKTEVL